MNYNEENPDQASMSYWIHNRSWTFGAIILGVQVLIALISYPFLPAQVPSHWNIAGEIDGYMPKLVHAFFEPLLGAFFLFVLPGIIGLGPNVDADHKKSIVKVTYGLLPLFMLLALAIQLLTVAAAFKLPVNIPFVMNLFLSLLCIWLGNTMGKLRRNFWVGIRTPWTLANDTVWERTHRVGGWMFVAVGVLSLINGFIPGVGVFSGLVLLIVASILLVIYSYVVYRRVA